MTEKIGKLSLIFGAVLSILFVIAGFASRQFYLLSYLFYKDLGYYYLFMLIPFAVMFTSHLAAWLVSLKSAKNTENQQEKSGNIGIFFKAYFYLWAIVSVLIAIGGFMFFDFYVHYLSRVFCAGVLMSGAALFSTVVVSILVWAVFSMWKVNKVVGVIVAVVTFVVFIGACVMIGALYLYETSSRGKYYPDDIEKGKEIALRNYYNNRDWERYDDAVVDANGQNKYYDDEKYDRAFRFMKYRLELEDEQSAYDLLYGYFLYFNPEGYWWKENDYVEGNESFHDEEDFRNCASDFYSIYDGSLKNNDYLMAIADYYASDMSGKGGMLSKDFFERSGANDCLRILLLAYDDIYSKEQHNEVLNDIYNIMTDNDIGCCLNSYYPALRPYMSDEVFHKIIDSKDDEDGVANRTLTTWAYSFWARRHHDGVDKTVYRILAIIDGIYN